MRGVSGWHFLRWSDSAFGKAETLKRGLQWLWVLACLSCAGELKDPGRFGFLYDDNDSGTKLKPEVDSGTEPMPMPMTTVPSCVTSIFKKPCGSSGCHDSSSAVLDLISPNVASRLVNKPSSNTQLCKGRTLISTSGDSLLIDKISDDPPCGSPMPLSGTPLTDDQRTCLTDWVSSLANQN